MLGSVVKKYSSRCVPVRSWTKTQRTATSPWPDLYQWPVPLTTATSRRPPPYQATFSLVRRERTTTSCGEGSSLPLTRGRPCPEEGGGGSYQVGPGPEGATPAGAAAP